MSIVSKLKAEKSMQAEELLKTYLINAINDYIEKNKKYKFIKNKEYNFIKNQKTEEIKPAIDSAELISYYLMSNLPKREKIKLIKEVFEHNKDRHLQPEELIETIISHLYKYFIKKMDNFLAQSTTLDYTDLKEEIEKYQQKETGFIKTPKTNSEQTLVRQLIEECRQLIEECRQQDTEFIKNLKTNSGQTSLIQLIEKYKQKDIELIKTPRTDPKQNAK